MSEYQYYEFQAIDRPLSRDEIAELRALSTRATITPTRFVNVYNWGDFRGDPSLLMEKYFDALLYLANWGTREFMLRLPRRLLDLQTARLSCTGDSALARTTSDHVILEFRSEHEGGDWEADGEGWLSSLVPLRADLAGGDLRALYLGWLLCAQSGELDDEAVEPPVPPGLSRLPASLTALVEFLRVDGDLVAIAAERSAGIEQVEASPAEVASWLRDLPGSEKDDLLLQLVDRPEAHARAELLQRFRRSKAGPAPTREGAPGAGRTVAQLLSAAEQRSEVRRRQEAEHQARERTRREREQAAARATYLDGLAGHEQELWRRIEALVDTKRPADYDQAVRLVTDLRDLAARAQRTVAFDARLDQLRQRHVRKPSFISRLDEAGLPHE